MSGSTDNSYVAALQIVKRRETLDVGISADGLEEHPGAFPAMQSAAFLPILLMFIAISSRMRVLCLELQNVLQQIVSNIELLPTDLHTTVPTATLEQKDLTAAPLESNLLSTSISGHAEYGRHGTPSLPSHQTVKQAHIAVERKIPTRIQRDERKDASHPEPAPKKKRRKVARNDIDDIFGS